MKKGIVCTVLIVALLTLAVFLIPSEQKTEEYLRIHIRANGNESDDQNVKYLVRDEIVEYLTPLLAHSTDYESALRTVKGELPALAEIADGVLEKNGFAYRSKARLSVEEFPTRSYGELTLNSGLYEALIIELGSGEGDNWWCVAFPPLCFVPAEGKNVVYKSKILEIIEKYLDKD